VLGDVVGISQSGSDSLRTTWREAERVVDSSIVPLSATVSTTDVDVVIANRGRLKYAEPALSEWEIVVRYEDAGGTPYVEYLSYASTLATGTWTVQQIYLDQGTATNEIYEPDILNPDEEMVIRARLANAAGASTVNMVTVSPPEGGAGTVHFNG
jgi:hypothetical protein